eukprot:TRINITY_DN23459_c0_g1_i2.p1 TRINITY_DN23459_c0_g1~~TRINITY_DN23459_c0_g1_i2.p1  ORF type:complete len:156 (+),score=8.23 TRINITY_DN23459_c0_g1_i2:170-637(+)
MLKLKDRTDISALRMVNKPTRYSKILTIATYFQVFQKTCYARTRSAKFIKLSPQDSNCGDMLDTVSRQKMETLQTFSYVTGTVEPMLKSCEDYFAQFMLNSKKLNSDNQRQVIQQNPKQTKSQSQSQSKSKSKSKNINKSKKGKESRRREDLKYM